MFHEVFRCAGRLSLHDDCMKLVQAIPLWLLILCVPAFAQSGGGAHVKGRVTDETGGALPGVTVELLGGSEPREAVTDGRATNVSGASTTFTSTRPCHARSA